MWSHHEPESIVSIRAPVPEKVRYVTPFTRLVGPITLTQKRFGTAECSDIGNTWVKNFSNASGGQCLSAQPNGRPFGVDPAFLPTSSIYNGKLSPERFYDSSERFVSSRIQPANAMVDSLTALLVMQGARHSIEDN